MKTIRFTAVTLLTLLATLIFVPVAWAHPLGNFTINQYAGLNISREMIRMEYIVDMAEIPAFQEIATFDSNGNSKPDADELTGYAADKCASLQTSLSPLANHQPLTLALASSSVEFPAGVGGLPTLRLTCEFQSFIDLSQGALNLSFTNNAFPERIGWSEIVIYADGVSLHGDFAVTSLSHRLTNYPQDLLTSPLDQHSVELEITSGPTSIQSDTVAPASPSETVLQDRNDPFTRLILMDEITLPALLLALLISFIWGAAHAMTPGHGKTIVGAYLVGSRGTVKHAVYLGLTTTITHTLGVFAFGLITLFAAQYIVLEKLYPWMSLLSGLFVVGIGLNLFVERFRSSGLAAWIGKLKFARRLLQPAYASSPSLHIQTAEHKHDFVFASRHGHSHEGDRHHSHYFHDEAHEHHHEHHHDHHHTHGHGNHDHAHGSHSHTPPEAITWRGLLALGVSGGLLPCPSALVVLLSAIALSKIGFGLILVLAFSLGLAGALTAIGLAFLYAGKLFERVPAQGKIIRSLPAFSALFISLIGLGIVVRALAEVGIV